MGFFLCKKILQTFKFIIMSMICFVGQVSDQEIDHIKAYPKRAELLINEGRYFEEPAKRSFLQKLFGKKETPAVAPDPSYITEPTCDLDKAWHALHYVLTGDPGGGEFPLNFLATGGQEIGEDMGYGPLRFLTAGETILLKNELDKISVADFANRFNSKDMNAAELYPAHDDWNDEDKKWLTDAYAGIKQFIDQAVKNKKGIYINIA